jgi:decaprenylphospho-beta-D-erythro-pentofuranosid-2-ulose 2-reductase
MKKILIVGAASAIASSCARLWAAQGASFFLVGRHLDKLEQVAADLQSRGAVSVVVHVMDAMDVPAHPVMLQSCQDVLGQLDIALIAHGTLPDQAACEANVDLALKEFANNGSSVIALLTLLANQFEKQGNGSIAVISSVAGERGRPSNYVYGSAKAAVSAFCEGMRARLFKRGVHLVTIKPGFVDTPMTQGLSLPRLLLAQPEQVAGKIVRAVDARTDVVYVPGFWGLIMLLVRSIPQMVFKRLNL